MTGWQSEFPRQATAWEDIESGDNRRHFLKLMGASLALAGLTGCTRQPTEFIMPYVRQPEELIPGRPLFFATAMTLGGYATGLLVESHEGRPTKAEGNPDHPASLGACDVYSQASDSGLVRSGSFAGAELRRRDPLVGWIPGQHSRAAGRSSRRSRAPVCES